LHKFVWECKELPASEYLGWIAYFEEKERKKEVKRGNIMAMDSEELTKAFPRGN